MLGGALFLHQRRLTEAFRLAGMCLVAAASFAIISFGRHLNEFFLATAQWIFLLTGVLSLAAIDIKAPRVRRSLLGGVVAGLVLAISYNANLVHWNIGPDARRGRS